ncbi:hypothetical protein LOAG_02895 [Loa loa]|uniref:Uncharacterized protein n=1 Tax=Loa loa TaxID=7209 RepID=A0A1S0U5I5_LOALO|nr:hypothetical protein LOAG_02895 [Loa loa]EFO25587.2 hypothetical protein LOAG_02895 [Loa loa]
MRRGLIAASSEIFIECAGKNDLHESLVQQRKLHHHKVSTCSIQQYQKEDIVKALICIKSDVTSCGSLGVQYCQWVSLIRLTYG